MWLHPILVRFRYFSFYSFPNSTSHYHIYRTFLTGILFLTSFVFLPPCKHNKHDRTLSCRVQLQLYKKCSVFTRSNSSLSLCTFMFCPRYATTSNYLSWYDNSCTFLFPDVTLFHGRMRIFLNKRVKTLSSLLSYIWKKLSCKVSFFRNLVIYKTSVSTIHFIVYICTC